MVGPTSACRYALAALLPLAAGACSIGPVQAQASAGCIETRQIVGTTPRDDRRIDYRLKDGRRLRNDLPATCRGLFIENDFDYATWRGQICPGDRIVVTTRAAGTDEAAGASCALGNFSPVQGD